MAQRRVRAGDAPVSRRKSTKVRVEGMALACTVTYRKGCPIFWPLRTTIPHERLSLELLGKLANSTEYQPGQVAPTDTARTAPKPNPL